MSKVSDNFEIAAFFRVLSIFIAFDGHAHVSRLNPQAGELSCLCCHITRTLPGTIRTLPNNLQGWLEHQYASRSASSTWFLHSHLLWSLGEFNGTHRGHHASWPEQHWPLPWTGPAVPCMCKTLLQTESRPSYFCLPQS